MKLLTLTLALTLLGFASVFGQGELRPATVQHDGVERTYNVFVPSTYSPTTAMPLVVNMHGLGGNADLMKSTAMNSVAEENGFLVVYPNATDNDWTLSPDHNVSFIAETLLDTLKNDYSVDDSRVYATGLSQGGMMSYLLGISHPESFAAIAPVGGTRPFFTGGSGLFPTYVDRVPDRPMPLMHVHGTDDIVIPYQQGGTVLGGVYDDVVFPSVMDTVLAEWAASNGCDPNVTAFTEMPDIVTDDNSTVSTFSFTDCETYTTKSGTEIVAEVEHIRVNDGGHSWPVFESDRDVAITTVADVYGEEALPIFLPLNSDISASEEIWSFFQRHEVAAVVPEPSGHLMILLGGLGMMFCCRRSRRRTAKR